MAEKGVDAYPSVSLPHEAFSSLQQRYGGVASGERSASDEQVAGRVNAIRNSGMFVDLVDSTGSMQLFFDLRNEDLQTLLAELDIGDFIAVEGAVRRTKRGELTIDVRGMRILSKALRNLPDKYHGLQDVETRYRHRYLDILSNAASAERFRKRSRLLLKLRELLHGRGYMEVETPMLHTIYGGAAAEPFRTYHQALDANLYLRIAPELYLKQVLVSGLSEKIFEINRNFRNEGLSTRHNPEFTMLEAYSSYSDWTDMIDLMEDLINGTCRELNGSEEASVAGRTISFARPFRRRDMSDLVFETTGLNFASTSTDEEARALAASLGLALEGRPKWGECLAAAFEERVEKTLIDPIHVTGFPADVSPLAKRNQADPRFAERFETYVNGWEIGNAFSEMNDPQLQRQVMQDQVVEARSAGEVDRELDEAFIMALEHGMPPAGGLGLGIDRLVMLLTDSTSIRDVILFPTLRRVAKGKPD